MYYDIYYKDGWAFVKGATLDKSALLKKGARSASTSTFDTALSTDETKVLLKQSIDSTTYYTYSDLTTNTIYPELTLEGKAFSTGSVAIFKDKEGETILSVAFSASDEFDTITLDEYAGFVISKDATSAEDWGTITLDGVNTPDLEEIFYIQESESGSELYVPIRRIAKFFNYEDYRGDYKYKSEDNSKCHVKNEYETAMFTLDSNIIIKTRGNSDYEYVELDEKVFEMNGELYTTIDGIKKAFNVEFIYDAQAKNIEIYTMDYLIQLYATHLNLTDYNPEFSDKKAIFENMLVIQQNGAYGVVDATTGESILETKYDSIKYLPNTNLVLQVTSYH